MNDGRLQLIYKIIMHNEWQIKLQNKGKANFWIDQSDEDERQSIFQEIYENDSVRIWCIKEIRISIY